MGAAGRPTGAATNGRPAPASTRAGRTQQVAICRSIRSRAASGTKETDQFGCNSYMQKSPLCHCGAAFKLSKLSSEVGQRSCNCYLRRSLESADNGRPPTMAGARISGRPVGPRAPGQMQLLGAHLLGAGTRTRRDKVGSCAADLGPPEVGRPSRARLATPRRPASAPMAIT